MSLFEQSTISHSNACVDHLVVDTSAFIRNAKLERFGRNIYSCSEVVSEVKDRAAKERLQVLPYELNFREPSQAALDKVSLFAKSVGELSSLSAVDKKLIALTYDLHVEFCGDSQLKQEPGVFKKEVVQTQKVVENPKDIAGFYIKPSSSSKSHEALRSRVTSDSKVAVTDCKTATKDAVETVSPAIESIDSVALTPSTKIDEESDSGTGEKSDNSSADDERDESEGSTSQSCESEADDSEDGGESAWITPDNLAEMIDRMGGLDEEPQSVKVGCMTTDFAMQNVLLHMGLKVISLDGMLIKRLRSYVLRCKACFHSTNSMAKQFCPQCGNATLTKVAVTVDEEGNMRYHLSARKALRKTQRHSLPLPKGGKHVTNPRLVEDQPMPHNRLSKKALQKLNVFDDDYEARPSPFLMNDVSSKSAVLGLRCAASKSRRLNAAALSAGQGKKRGGKKR